MLSRASSRFREQMRPSSSTDEKWTYSVIVVDARVDNVRLRSAGLEERKIATKIIVYMFLSVAFSK